MNDSDATVTFLLVDDDEVDVMVVQRAFSKAGIAEPPLVAGDGVEALDCLRGTGGKQAISRPYVILLDLNMPRMNGIEFLRELRADPEHKDAVVFVLTSSKDARQKTEAYRYNVAGFIVKSGVMADFYEFARMLDMFSRLIELP